MAYETILKYDSENNIEYVLKALPGTSLDSEAWQITKIFYNEDNSVTRLGFANNSDSFIHKASDYLLYKYNAVLMTIIRPLKNIPAKFVMDFSSPQSSVMVIGNIPDLLESEERFNSVPFIAWVYNNKELKRGEDVVWISFNTVIFNMPLVKDQSIVVRS